MIEWLAGADIAVVTLGAVTGVYADVIEGGIGKARSGVADSAVLGSRQVVCELADADDVVMARFTVVDHTEMVITAGRERPRCVTHGAVFSGRHVVGWHSASGNAMTGGAVVDDTAVINEGIAETAGVMTEAAIGIGDQVGGYRGSFTRRADTVVVVVAGLAGLQRGINQSVVEYTTHVEGHDTVAGSAIDECLWVAGGGPDR